MFYGKVRGVALEGVKWTSTQTSTDVHCDMSENIGLLLVLCKQVQKSSTPLVLLKILKEKHPITGLLSSIDQAMSATRIKNHSNYRSTTLAEHQANLDKSQGACSQCATFKNLEVIENSSCYAVLESRTTGL